MDTAIKRADEKMSFISKDKEALRYHRREMALSDFTSGLNHAKFKRGFVDGEKL